jgi:fumarate hydratase, class II
MKFRTENDSMGSIKIPENAYYGAQTFRASENFKISELRLPGEFISAVALIKKCAAQTHLELGLIGSGDFRNHSKGC